MQQKIELEQLILPESDPISLDVSFPKNYAARIKALPDNLQSSTAVGLHGTSIHAVSGLFKNGRLPSVASNNSVFIYPMLSTLKDADSFRCTLPPVDEVVNSLGLLAESHAHEAWIMEYLDIDFNDDEARIAVGGVLMHNLDYVKSDFEESKDFDFLNKHRGISIERMRAALTTIPEQDLGGVAIAFNRKIYDEYEVYTPPLDEDDGFAIIAPSGISIDAIDAIKPLGKLEQEFFVSQE